MQHMRQLFSLANDFKEGDLSVGGTRDDRQRLDARRTLLSITAGATTRAPLTSMKAPSIRRPGE